MHLLNADILAWVVRSLCCYTTFVSQMYTVNVQTALMDLLAIYFQSVQGVSASESGIRNLPLILSMSKSFSITNLPSSNNSISTFHHSFRRSAHGVWPLCPVLDLGSSHIIRRCRLALHFRRGFSIFSLDWLSDPFRHRTWAVFPGAHHSWPSTC